MYPLRPINAIKSAPVCCKLMELFGYLHFPAQTSIGCNAKLRTHFQQDTLPRFPWLPFMFVDIDELRMRINLQQRGCFSLAAVGVKRFIYWMCAGMFVWIGSTNVPKFSLIGSKTNELLRVKISGFPYQLWTAYFRLIWPSPIGMKLVPDERFGPMTPWDQMTKNSYHPFSSYGPWKLIFANVWHLITY